MLKSRYVPPLFLLGTMCAALTLSCNEIETVKPKDLPKVYATAVTVPDTPGFAFSPAAPGSPHRLTKFPPFHLTSKDLYIFGDRFDPKDAFDILDRGYSHIDDHLISGDIDVGKNLQNRSLTYKRRMRFMSDNVLGDGKEAPNFYKGQIPPESEIQHIISVITGDGKGNGYYDDNKWADWTIIDFEFSWPAPGVDSFKFNQTWSRMAQGLRAAYPYTKVSAGGLINSATEEAWEPMDARVVQSYMKHSLWEGNGFLNCQSAPQKMRDDREVYHERWPLTILVTNEWFRKTYPGRKNLSWQQMQFEECIGTDGALITDDLAEGMPIWHSMTGGVGLVVWGVDSRMGRANEFFTNGMYRLAQHNQIRSQNYEYVTPRISFDGKSFGEQRTISYAVGKGQPSPLAPKDWKMIGKPGRQDPREPVIRAVATENSILIVGFDPTLKPGEERTVYVNHRDWVGKIVLKYRHTFLGGVTDQSFGRAEN